MICPTFFHQEVQHKPPICHVRKEKKETLWLAFVFLSDNNMHTVKDMYCLHSSTKRTSGIHGQTTHWLTDINTSTLCLFILQMVVTVSLRGKVFFRYHRLSCQLSKQLLPEKPKPSHHHLSCFSKVSLLNQQANNPECLNISSSFECGLEILSSFIQISSNCCLIISGFKPLCMTQDEAAVFSYNVTHYGLHSPARLFCPSMGAPLRPLK